MHVLRDLAVGDEGDQAPVGVVREGEARLLPDLADEALFGAFLVLKLAADADPLVLVDVVFFLDAVEHEVLPLALDVAERGVPHGVCPPVQ